VIAKSRLTHTVVAQDLMVSTIMIPEKILNVQHPKDGKHAEKILNMQHPNDGKYAEPLDHQRIDMTMKAFFEKKNQQQASSTTSAEQMKGLMKKKDAGIASLQEDIKKLQEAAAGNSAAEGDNNIARTANLGYSHDDSGETDAADGKPLMLLSQHFAKMVKGLDFYSKQVTLVELVSY
jgi:hypothetical protein